MGTAFQFLTVFLKKCGSKQEDVDYRPLFENFLQVHSLLILCACFCLAASCVQSRQFFASTLREQLFELKNEDAIKKSENLLDTCP